MYVVIWKFRVRHGADAVFRKIYGPSGDWATLFRTSPGFLGTELLRDLEGGHRYMTIDRWQTRQAYESFRRERSAEYAALDSEGAHLTDVEALVGEFTAVGTDQRAAAPADG